MACAPGRSPRSAAGQRAPGAVQRRAGRPGVLRDARALGLLPGHRQRRVERGGPARRAAPAGRPGSGAVRGPRAAGSRPRPTRARAVVRLHPAGGGPSAPARPAPTAPSPSPTSGGSSTRPAPAPTTCSPDQTTSLPTVQIGILGVGASVSTGGDGGSCP
ncbi:hypothetical protein [Sinomonas atrocyanea]